MEEISFDTFSSAMEVSRVLKSQANSRRVILVTSALQMRRARFACRHAGVDVIECPTDYLD